MYGTRAVVSAVWLFLFPLAIRAQSVRGIVVDSGDRPVAGVVVLLLDSVSQVTARALSNERGEFRVVSPQPGTYHIRTLRIGFRPVTSMAVVLHAGGEIVKRLKLSGLAIALDTMRVVDRNVCRAFTDSGAATYAVWEQVRTALIAAELTAASRTIAATTVTFERAFDPGPGRFTGRVLRQQSNVSTEYVSRIWRALPQDSLHRVGYVVTDRDNSTTYYAPDLAVLLSNQFVEDHCFRFTTDRNHNGLLGIAFEPVPERRRGAAEIRGTIWTDRASSELRQLEFRYVNVTREQEAEARADLALVRMRDGTWAISRWNIRMPVVVEVLLPGRGTEPRITEIRVAGGELALARRGTDTLWRGPPRVLTGTLIDSLSGSPLAGARVAVSGTVLEATSDPRGRFTIPAMLPGQYTLHVTTPSLDSLSAVHQSSLTFTDATTALEIRVPNGQQVAATLCGPATRGGLSGIVAGLVRLHGDSTTADSVRGARIVAEWSADGADSTHVRRLEVRAAPDGRFRLCGLPMNTALTLSATADSAETREASVVRLALTARFARAELTLDRVNQLALVGATFTGVVVSDSTHEPIAGAEVAVSGAGQSVITEAHGAFRLTGIPSGEHQIVVRRIGFGPADTRLAFRGNETVERRVVLGRAVVLEAVTVTEKAIERAMASFEENRRVGLGHFMTRAELAKYDGMKLAGVLQQLGGIKVISSRSAAWVTSKHAPVPLCPPGPGSLACLESHGVYLPEAFERLQGMITACYSLVYLDGVLMNGIREPTEPFDVNSIAPEQIEAMEFYAGPAETPVKYSRMGSNCGVLVILETTESIGANARRRECQTAPGARTTATHSVNAF